MFRILTHLLFILIVTDVGASLAEEVVVIKDGEVKIRINGVVCSLCAYGIERNISKLPFIDRSLFGKDGVHLDVDKQMITIGVEKDMGVDLKTLYSSIIKAGYEPVTFYLRFSGAMKKVGEVWTVTPTPSGTTFQLTGKKIEAVHGEPNEVVFAQIQGSDVKTLKKNSNPMLEIYEVRRP